MTDFPSLRGRGPVAIDCETRDDDLKTRGPGAHRDGYIAGVAVAVEGFSEYYPIAHETGPNLDRGKVLDWLKRELSRSDQPKIGANILYDLAFLSAAGVDVVGPFYDVQVAEPLLNENLLSYSLENLAQRYLKTGKRSEEMTDWIKEKFKVRKPGNYIWRAPSSIVAPYAIGDVEMPLKIFKLQEAQLRKQDLWDLFLLESSLIPMLLAMRQRGVRVDLKRAEELFDNMTHRQNKIMRAVGVEFAPWNARDIAKIFDRLGIEYPHTEKTNAPSFTKEWLAHHPHPTAQMIHEIRHLDKLRNTFVKGAIIEGHHKGRLHPQFHLLRSDQYGTVSGRMSSSNPNAQQIPARTDEGKQIRSLFIPEKGQLFFKTDFSQIEYRILAATAADMQLHGAQDVVDKYNTDRGADFHQIVADMTGLDRRTAKTINFACSYGAGVGKICEQLGLDLNAGTKILNDFHRRAPFLRPLSNAFMDEASRNGQIETLLGRVRRFHMWETKNLNGERQYSTTRSHGAKRAFTYSALNSYVQGSAADIFKQACALIWRSGVCDVLGPPHLLVHDEISGSMPDTKQGREALEELQHIMENAVKLSVPLLIDVGTGKNWGDC